MLYHLLLHMHSNLKSQSDNLLQFWASFKIIWRQVQETESGSWTETIKTLLIFSTVLKKCIKKCYFGPRNLNFMHQFNFSHPHWIYLMWLIIQFTLTVANPIWFTCLKYKKGFKKKTPKNQHIMSLNFQSGLSPYFFLAFGTSVTLPDNCYMDSG